MHSALDVWIRGFPDICINLGRPTCSTYLVPRLWFADGSAIGASQPTLVQRLASPTPSLLHQQQT